MSVKRNGGASDGEDPPSGGDWESSTSDAASLGLDRRDFLKLVGSTVSAAAAAACNGEETASGSLQQALHIEGDQSFDFSFKAVRKEDLVDLRFDFLNLVPDKDNLALQRKVTGAPTLVVVSFPSQHVFEAAFRETDVESPGQLPDDETAPIGARVAGGSRVAFVVPDSIGSIPLTLQGLLDLIGQLELHVAKNALPPPVTPTPAALPLLASVSAASSNGKSSRTRQLLRRQRAAYAQKHWLPPAEVVTSALEVESSDPPSPPLNHETSLEIPFRLLLSPNRYGAFAHASTPVGASSGRYELWHSRLGTRIDGVIDERDPTLRRVRALWTRDPGFDPSQPDTVLNGNVFTAPELDTLFPDDRKQIVHLTSNFERFSGPGVNPEDPLPRPVDVNLLMLTSMGGWLDVKGKWQDNDLNDTLAGAIEEWQHRATLGRDHFVKVVRMGLIWPFGHRVVRVDLTERKFKPAHPHTAYLRKRTFLVVREPVKHYDVGRDPTDSGVIAQNLRTLPFGTIKVTTLVTPPLDIIDEPDDELAQAVFIPMVGGTYDQGSNSYSGGHPFRFGLEAMDDDGNIISFTAPVVWVKATFDQDLQVQLPDEPAATLLEAVDQYTNDLSPEERKCVLAGQRFAYAPSNQTDDTALETQTISFDGFRFDNQSLDEETLHTLQRAYPDFFPQLARAELALESARQVSGKADDIVRTFVYHDKYFEGGFSEDVNAGELLLTLDAGQDGVKIDFGSQSDRSGGFLAPNFAINGVSRRIGPVSGDTSGEAVEGLFNPQEFFAGLGTELLPKLFGVLSLTDILKAVDVDLSQAPKYITQVVTGAMGAIADLERLADSLRSVGVSVETELESIGDLFDDLEAAFGGDEDAIAGIDGDINAVIADLQNLPTTLAGMTINPLAFKNELIARAQSLASALDGVVGDLLELIADLASGVELPSEIRTHLEWRGKVQRWADAGAFKNFFVPFDPSDPGSEEGIPEADALLLTADIVAKADGDPEVNLKCSLENFKVRLFGDSALFLVLTFDLLEFSVQNGKKPDVRLLFNEEHGITFAGPLAFIESLKSMIPLDGFSDPPNLDVDASGITASFSLALPNIAVGVLSLENIVLAAALRIPFLGEALSFTFNFSTRENPFNLTVSLLGGGGFFGLELTPKGVKMLEASLEAGARLSVDLGVASGSISAMIGIYFRIEKLSDDEDQVLLTGYFRLRGEVDVLGLISASITLTLELTYQASPVNKLYGRATLEIEVDVAFFSASVTITCERRFAGSGGDPTFFQVMEPEGDYRPWDEYVAAFAA